MREFRFLAIASRKFHHDLSSLLDSWKKTCQYWFYRWPRIAAYGSFKLWTPFIFLGAKIRKDLPITSILKTKLKLPWKTLPCLIHNLWNYDITYWIVRRFRVDSVYLWMSFSSIQRVLSILWIRLLCAPGSQYQLEPKSKFYSPWCLHPPEKQGYTFFFHRGPFRTALANDETGRKLERKNP